jgi:LPXTG-motif cell wall-anchored protein
MHRPSGTGPVRSGQLGPGPELKHAAAAASPSSSPTAAAPSIDATPTTARDPAGPTPQAAESKSNSTIWLLLAALIGAVGTAVFLARRRRDANGGS